MTQQLHCLCALLATNLFVGPASSSLAGDGFLTDCLVAGTTADACEVDWLQSQFAELAERIDPQSLTQLPVEMRLRELHRRLHAEILVGSYRPEASDLRETILRGDYNCLSATALYWELSRAAGLKLQIWSLPGHVELRTTAPQSFVVDAAAREWPAREADRPREPRARRLSSEQLVAKFYYNRAVLALHRREHAAGIEWLRQSLALDPQDPDAAANLVAGLNNWAVELYRQQRYTAARALLQEGLALDPQFAPLVSNERQLRKRHAP
jgi:tetratricopeptide (TPR) repeat protein